MNNKIVSLSKNEDYKKKQFVINNNIVKQGDWITLDGSQGSIYLGKLSLVKPNIQKM